MNPTYKPFSDMSIQSFLRINFFIFSFGLLGFVKHLSGWLGQRIFDQFNTFISYSEWAAISTSTNKPSELIQYGLSVLALAFYYLIASIYTKRCPSIVEPIFNKATSTKGSFIIYLLLILSFNLLQILYGGKYSEALPLLWFIYLLVPALPLIEPLFSKLGNVRGWWSESILSILIIVLGFTFYPFIGAELALSNDYMDIPEQTILKSGVVDNTEYINNHNLGGLNKYDPRFDKGESPVPLEIGYIKLEKSRAISKISEYKSHNFYYNDKINALVVKDLLDSNDLDMLVKLAANKDEIERIHNFHFDQLKRLKVKRDFTSEEIEFLRKNKRELVDQALAGHYFHHQNTILGTINEYSLGKPRTETVFLYGWLSTVIIAECMKFFGGITFEAYQKVFYSFYPIYYILAIAIAAIIFKKIAYVLMVAIISIGSLQLLGFEFIRFAPGFNPIRHFFDIFSLLFFYWYLFSTKRNSIYLSLALGFAVLGILFSKEFGLVLFLSLIASVFCSKIENRKNALSDTFVVGTSIIGAVSALTLIKTGSNPTLIYVLLGVASPNINWISLLCLLITFSALYVHLVFSRAALSRWTLLTLFFFLYSQGLLIYYVWNPVPNHLVSLGVVLAILLALIIKSTFERFSAASIFEGKILAACNILLLVVVLFPGTLLYYMDYRDYRAVFQNHTTHYWNFPTAKFQSTMDPSVFEDSVRLINQYSDSKTIFLLSKYDNLLPFLSSKYNTMPFTEMGLSLVTTKELSTSIELIRRVRPKYIFVDTDMTRSHLGDIYEFEKNGSLNSFFAPYDMVDASRGRALVLNNLAKVFKGVSDIYVPVAVGQLITVYELRVND